MYTRRKSDFKKVRDGRTEVCVTEGKVFTSTTKVGIPSVLES